MALSNTRAHSRDDCCGFFDFTKKHFSIELLLLLLSLPEFLMALCNDVLMSSVLFDELDEDMTFGSDADKLLAAVRDMYALIAESIVGRSLRSDWASASAGFMDDMDAAAARALDWKSDIFLVSG